MIDLILTWPNHYDYPLYRKQMAKCLKFFNRMIVCFTDNRLEDNSEEITRKLRNDWGDKLFITRSNEDSNRDWRDAAIHNSLLLTTPGSPYILFMEQDFIIDVDPNQFFEQILSIKDEVSSIGMFEVHSNRWHPAFLMCDKSDLENTSKDFSPKPNEYDHFGGVTRDLLHLYDIDSLEEVGIPSNWYHHMAGLTNNMYLKECGATIQHNPKEFEDYLIKCEEILNAEK